MKKLMNLTYLKIFSLILLASCDTLKSDDVDPSKSVRIDHDKQYVLSGEMGVIDLRSRITATQPVDFKIGSQPEHGQLESIGAGLLKYTPHTDFRSGRDGFAFSVYSKTNTLIKQDTIIIVVGDSTNLPCGLYARTDYVYGVKSAVDIDVLANDEICMDSSKIKVSLLLLPGSNIIAYSGTVVVLPNNKIRYTPASNFLSDKFMYKITSLRDTTQSSYAFVRLTAQSSCHLRLSDDNITIHSDSTYNIMMLQNDSLCQAVNNYSISINQNPSYGTAVMQGNYISYKLTKPPVANFTDTLSYQLCVDENCQRAKVTVNVKVK